MRRELLFTNEPIDERILLARRVATDGMGASVYFAGMVRAREGGMAIRGLEYEAFFEMAERQFHLIFDRVETRWPVESVRLVHRLGFVPAGQASLWVEVIAPHRGAAFAASQFLIDEMKLLVPIWKKPISEKA